MRVISEKMGPKGGGVHRQHLGCGIHLFENQLPLAHDMVGHHKQVFPGPPLLAHFHGSRISAAVDREKEYLKNQIAGLISMLEGPADAITFDQLEINTLFVDEAHNFKNIPLRSNLKRISGVNITGSKKCLEMLHTAALILETYPSDRLTGNEFLSSSSFCSICSICSIRYSCDKGIISKQLHAAVQFDLGHLRHADVPAIRQDEGNTPGPL